MSVDLTNTLIPCPDRGFELRRAHVCFSCEFYKGITRATENGESIPGNEANFYQVVCSKPISRKLIQVLRE